jgi:hypothetical protein
METEILHKGIKYLLLYLYNTSAETIIQDLFPDAVPMYFEEKLNQFCDNRTEFYSRLDETKQKQLIEAAVNKYEK